MALPRPITICYSLAVRERVTHKTAMRVGRACYVPSALIAAHSRVVQGHFNRADVYNSFGAHIYSIIRYPKIGIATVSANIPLSIRSDDDVPRQFSHSLHALPRGRGH